MPAVGFLNSASVDAFHRTRAHESYIATDRRAWWSVGLRALAPILCTYMARRARAFVRNKVLARHINIAHGLYPRAPLSDAELRAVLAYLRSFTSTTGGRTYAGGLIKFEPKELERTLLPRLEDIHIIHIICSGSTVWPTSPPS
jgi:adenine-specific DNA-methyltransferase